MKKSTNVAISIAVAIALATVFLIRGRPRDHAATLATETIPSGETAQIAEAVALAKERSVGPSISTPISEIKGHTGSPFANASEPDMSRTGNQVRGQTSPTGKHHGCVKGIFDVISNLPEELQSTLFSPGAQYPAQIRFSNHRGSASDTEPNLRGLAIKLYDVPGEKFTGDERAHDLLLASHPVFLFRDAKTYINGIRALEKDQALRFFFNPLSPQLSAYRISKEMFSEHTNLLTMRWWSMVPYKFNQGQAVKYAARPCSNGGPIKQNYGRGTSDDFLRERLRETLAAGPVCYEFMVQIQSDPVAMPIEDPTVQWNEIFAPFQPVALLTIPAKNLSDEELTSSCTNLSFHPWRAVEAHRPLGGINRARREIYDAVSASRTEPHADITLH